jgi:hypothetical protein
VPLLPWDHVPNVRRYYARLAIQIFSDAFSYWWGQIAAGLIVAAVGVPIAWHYGWFPKGSLWWTMSVSFVPYAVIIVVSLAVNAIRAPVKLDNARATEAAQILTAKESIESRLEDSLTKISPVEQARREHVAEQLKRFNKDHKEVLRRLLRGKTHSRITSRWDLDREVSNHALRMGVDAGLVIHTPPSIRSMDQNQYWEVHPDYRESLTFHLHKG